MSRSSILFQSEDGSVVLLDLPRTIEEAQLLPGDLDSGSRPLRRLLSSKPPDVPFPTPEPSHGQLICNTPTPSAQVAELMTLAAVQSALDQVRAAYAGPWCLPRVLLDAGACSQPLPPTPEKRVPPPSGQNVEEKKQERGLEQCQQAAARDQTYIPRGAQYLQGSIESQRTALLSKDILFKLIVLDPPWPNRSARRKKRNSYATAGGLDEIGHLLSLVPVASCLSSDGLVAVWVTNAPRFADLLTSAGGVLAGWGLELVGEWTWLKVTTQGEPVFNAESAWRKPWERLLIARRRGSSAELSGGWRRRVIIAVPDVHSRKPNLRGLFDDVLGPGYPALEVFARNLTAGWWSWGDEALRFQASQHWADDEGDDDGTVRVTGVNKQVVV